MILQEISRGIAHIEDLSLLNFSLFLENIDNYRITEKVDGAQFIFGIDDIGFYTSRETKGGIRVYNECDYKTAFQNSYIRSAHKILESILPKLKEAGLRSGMQIEAEALYGDLPNVVPYSGNMNYLIFLRQLDEKAPILHKLEQVVLENIYETTLEVPYTGDGIEIKLRKSTDKWMISRVPKIPTKSNISAQLNSLKEAYNQFLNSPSVLRHITKLEAATTPLNKRPEWCHPNDWVSVKFDLGVERNLINEQAQSQYIIPIKEMLLQQYVRNKSSAFGPLVENGGWIEGVVFRENNTGKMVKLVDKEVFGKIRTFAWSVRNSLTERAKGPSDYASFLAEVEIGIAVAIGTPTLGTIQAKSYLKKRGFLTEDSLDPLLQFNFNTAQRYCLDLIEHKRSDLLGRLDKYTNTKDNLQLNILDKTIKYESSIHRRTLETFASLFEKIETMSKSIEESNTHKDLLMVLIEKHLGNLT